MTVVLDSYALIGYLENEPGGEQVEHILEKAETGEMTLLLSLVNWGEVYYSTYREYGEAKAEEVTEILDQLPLRIVPVDRPLVYLASRLKGRYPIAYGDCFAAALAIQRGTKVVTADPEFEKLAEEVEVIWV